MIASQRALVSDDSFIFGGRGTFKSFDSRDFVPGSSMQILAELIPNGDAFFGVSRFVGEHFFSLGFVMFNETISFMACAFAMIAGLMCDAGEVGVNSFRGWGNDGTLNGEPFFDVKVGLIEFADGRLLLGGVLFLEPIVSATRFSTVLLGVVTIYSTSSDSFRFFVGLVMGSDSAIESIEGKQLNA